MKTLLVLVLLSALSVAAAPAAALAKGGTSVPTHGAKWCPPGSHNVSQPSPHCVADY